MKKSFFKLTALLMTVVLFFGSMPAGGLAAGEPGDTPD